MAERNLVEGAVKWFNGAKGYGFIVRSDGGGDIFVHANDVPGGSLRDGQEVAFEVEQTKKGTKAVRVRSADGSAPEEQPRLFVFSTKSSVQNYFRGRRSDAALLPDDLRERAKSAYTGLFGDPEGRERVDRHSHSGFMAEWRLRQVVKRAPKRRDLAFHLNLGMRKLPGANKETPQIQEVSAAELIRHLDGLSPDQCPVCKKMLPEIQGSCSGMRRCECGYSEYGEAKVKPLMPEIRESTEPEYTKKWIPVRVKDIPEDLKELLVHTQQIDVPENLLEPGQVLSGLYGILLVEGRPDLEKYNADSWGWSLGVRRCYACRKLALSARRQWRARVSSRRSEQQSRDVVRTCAHCGAFFP